VAAPELLHPPCPLCGGCAHTPVIRNAADRIHRKAGSFSVESCDGCQLVATRPQPSAERLGYYYEGVYSGKGASAARFWQASFIGRRVARYRARAVLRHAPLDASSRVLDVGCGYGAFLGALADSHGCALVGLDTDSPTLAQALHPERIAYHCGPVESLLPEHAGSFDAVTLFESLEHHADPVQALRAVRELLKPGGVCIVEVPDFGSPWRRVFGSWWLPLLVPQHLFHFTPGSLRQCMRAAGLEGTSAHRSMFYPAESTASLGLWLNEKLGRPLRRSRLRRERPDGVALLALLALWWLLVELPSQALLVLAGRSGHQLMAGRKATTAH
jgi:2-polyprenyl-3-methyl-5-hydroxy-6-metoxy-1,4-benzoquinol methylase